MSSLCADKLRPRRDTLALQVDLWSARGDLPKDLIEVEIRQKEITYSSRNRAATDEYKRVQKLRIALANLLRQLPAELREGEDALCLDDPEALAGHLDAALQLLEARLSPAYADCGPALAGES